MNTFNTSISKLTQNQKAFFHSDSTKKESFRREQLQILRKAILKREQLWYEAFQKDFRKCEFEVYATEIAIVVSEIDFTLRHLSKWMKPKRVRTSLLNFPSSDYIYHDPYGVSLIIAPWNYPLQLSIVPLIGAIAAGNCAILKPSEISSHVSSLIQKMIEETFKPEYITVVQGDASVAQELFQKPFDKIFFTGSTSVGKIVMQHAAKNLTPLTLELGGKCPCIVDHDAVLDVAASRITWGKFLNAGQTCIAPDYILVHESVHDQFIELMKKKIGQCYGANPQHSPDYPRIINQQHFERLQKYLSNCTIVCGGITDTNERYIAPTLLTNISWNDAIMQEEIFGPILPVLTFSDLNTVIEKLKSLPKPLALYYFGSTKEQQEKILQTTTSGGACINETVSHLINPRTPFGGVSTSGFGNYHGKESFNAFSHSKSVLRKGTWFDLPLKYAPYRSKKKLLEWAFRLLG